MRALVAHPAVEGLDVAVAPGPAGWDEVQTDAFAGPVEHGGAARRPLPGELLFASPVLVERLRRRVAFNPTGWYAFSDHNPIVATFED